MKTFVLVVTLLLLPFSAFALDTAKEGALRQVLNSTPPGAPVRLGTQISQGVVRLARANWSYSVQGGSSAADISLVDDEGKPFKLPNKAIIRSVLIDVQTAPTSVGAGASKASIALTAQTSGDLKAAATVGTYSGLMAGIPVGSAATSIKLTADRTLKLTATTQALTAGKMSVLVEYYLSE
jgi:hypothetical protein